MSGQPILIENIPLFIFWLRLPFFDWGTLSKIAAVDESAMLRMFSNILFFLLVYAS